ncbi:MAG TPA: OmpA family protein [Kofleriaceae bacterium]
MKALLLASLMALPALASADVAPRGPDFVAVAPPRGVDRTVAASDGLQPIEPLEIVMFGLNDTSLDPAAISQLDVLAKWLKKNPEQNLVVEGHTDKLGTRGYNYDLGERRALAVRSHLRSWGISGDRVITATFGEQDAHRAENHNDRRVIVFASDRPRDVLVQQVVHQTRAETVAWTDRGTKLSITK